MISRMFTTLLALVAVLFTSQISTADQLESKVVGALSGGNFSDLCHPDDVLVGLNYQAGKAINTIAGVCQRQVNGTLTGAIYGLHTWGTTPEGYIVFTATGQSRCPGPRAVKGLTLMLDKFQDIHGIRMTCSPMKPNTVQSLFTAEVGAGGEGAAVPGTHPLSCPGGSVAVGIQGRHGQLVDAIGLLCSTFPWHAASLALDPNRTVKCTGAATPSSRCPDQVPLQTRRARVPTWIYQTKGGKPLKRLQRGDTVSVDLCADGGQGWCLIFKPFPGFVKGSDFFP